MTIGPANDRKPPSERGVAFSLSGPGFHTGKPNRLSLSIREGHVGTASIGGVERVVWGDGAEPVAQGRCTRAGGVGPLEHLSAAALAHGVRGWCLAADHEDLPIFDGSAKIWSEAFGFLAGTAPVFEEVGFCPTRPMVWTSTRGGIIEVSPSDVFAMRVEWTPGPCGPEVWQGGSAALAEILVARTFVFVDDWLAARKAGYLLGTDASNGRLLRGDPSPEALGLAIELGVDPGSEAWTGGAARMANECAAHKAMDLVGDIGCWIGYLPRLSIFARDAGHDLHHLLGRALRDAPAIH